MEEAWRRARGAEARTIDPSTRRARAGQGRGQGTSTRTRAALQAPARAAMEAHQHGTSRAQGTILSPSPSRGPQQRQQPEQQKQRRQQWRKHRQQGSWAAAGNEQASIRTHISKHQQASAAGQPSPRRAPHTHTHTHTTAPTPPAASTCTNGACHTTRSACNHKPQPATAPSTPLPSTPQQWKATPRRLDRRDDARASQAQKAKSQCPAAQDRASRVRQICQVPRLPTERIPCWEPDWAHRAQHPCPT